jgi:aminoacrylate hydrolase
MAGGASAAPSAMDQRPRATPGEIRKPTLVVSGDQDFCLPPQHSEELARGTPGATRVTLSGGHTIHDEAPEKYFETVWAFIDDH